MQGFDEDIDILKYLEDVNFDPVKEINKEK